MNCPQDTIAVYRLHFPHLIDAKIYGRWGFWEAHLPVQACADPEDYVRLRKRAVQAPANYKTRRQRHRSCLPRLQEEKPGRRSPWPLRVEPGLTLPKYEC